MGPMMASRFKLKGLGIEGERGQNIFSSKGGVKCVLYFRIALKKTVDLTVPALSFPLAVPCKRAQCTHGEPEKIGFVLRTTSTRYMRAYYSPVSHFSYHFNSTSSKQQATARVAFVTSV